MTIASTTGPSLAELYETHDAGQGASSSQTAVKPPPMPPTGSRNSKRAFMYRHNAKVLARQKRKREQQGE